MNRRECCMKDVKVLNKKGFTLIELLAVIIILAVLMMLAGNSVINIMMNTRRSAFRTEFLALLDSAQLKAQTVMLGGKWLQKKGDTYCYCFVDKNDKEKVNKCTDKKLDSFDNKGNYNGSVLVTNTGSGALTFQGWMYSTSYAIEGKSSDIQDNETDVMDASKATVTGDKILTCGK